MRAASVAIAVLWLMIAAFGWALTRDEENNIEVYKRFNAGVVNITSRAVAYDFFFHPIPTDSSGSGIILDTQGRILTNHHVVKGAQRISSSEELRRYIRKRQPGDMMKVEFVRQGKREEVQVKLEERPRA